MDKKLEQQIAELTAKHNLKTSITDRLPFVARVFVMEINYREKGTTKSFTAYLDKTPLHELREKISKIIVEFPPTRNNAMICGKEIQTASPFLLHFSNGINNPYVKIDWVHEDWWCQIQLPVDYYSNDVKGCFQRKVTDCEHHYFPGKSLGYINKIQILSYKLDMFKEKIYFGGDVVNYIDDPADKEEFQSVVVNGHIPQFVEQWQNELLNR